ncbi:hypothetical protein CHUAL_004454 [Chamberlinius hualienensis]
MELKVWVEGIQRIVCGVSDATTCQDVVYALAHATGKTGRFTLVEKWRNNERLLPPQEHPLKVLSKWGEYANDVQLVLRRTSLDTKSSTLQADNPITKGVPVETSLPNNWQKASSPLSPTSGAKDLKKSLTFSAGGTANTTDNNVGGSSKDKILKDIKEANRIVANRNNPPAPNQPLKREANDKKQLAKSSEDIIKDNVYSASNYKSGKIEKEPVLPISRFAVGPNTRNYNTNYAGKALSAKQQQMSTSTRGVKVSSDEVPSIQSQFKSSPCGDQLNSDHYNNSGGPVSRIPTVIQPSNVSSRGTSQEVAGQNSCGGNGNKLPSLIPIRRVESSPKVAVQEENSRRPNGSYPVPVHTSIPKSRKINSEWKKPTEEEESVLGCGQQQKVVYDSCYRDLVRLINLQREKLSQQQAGLTQYDAEIMYWEEKQKDHQRQIEMIEREMEKMEASGRDLNEEMGQLEPLHLDDELDVGRQQEKMLQSELTLLRSKLSNCETELLQCKNKIRLLMDDISEDRRWKSKEDEERRHRERIVLSEIDDLQRDLQDIMKDYDTRVKSCDKLEQEVKQIESAIAVKKKQVESLVQEMKAANLESLALTPAEEIRHLLEGGAHKGPGSSRKIVGSPRQLENAVPTSKNPHGVWV